MYFLISSLLFTDTKQYPVFVGHKPGHNTPQRHRLDIQLLMIMDRTLYIAARLVLVSCTLLTLLKTIERNKAWRLGHQNP